MTKYNAFIRPSKKFTEVHSIFKKSYFKKAYNNAMKHLSTELSYNEPNHIKMSNETDHNDSCFTSPQTPV